MNIKVTNMTKVKYMSAKVTEYKNQQTGNSGLSYKLTLEIEDEFVALPCTKDVYDFLKNVARDSEIMIIANYSLAYKNLRVTDVKVCQ